MSVVKAGGIEIGPGRPLVLISGPCVVEAEETMFEAARGLKRIAARAGVPLIFKSSYEKDNRSAADSYGGPGLAAGLEILRRVGQELDLPVLTDVHRPGDVAAAAEVAAVLQVPAFLSRQTSLLRAVGASGRAVNIKKGQFMSPRGVQGSVDKVQAAGCRQVLVTERGSCFGYDRVVCDMTTIQELATTGCPVVFDAGHAAPRRDQIEVLARCGVAAGADAVFIEAHPSPATARCDGDRMLSLGEMEQLLPRLAALSGAVGPVG